jgi:hypothetical protein
MKKIKGVEAKGEDTLIELKRRGCSTKTSFRAIQADF